MFIFYRPVDIIVVELETKTEFHFSFIADFHLNKKIFNFVFFEISDGVRYIC